MTIEVQDKQSLFGSNMLSIFVINAQWCFQLISLQRPDVCLRHGVCGLNLYYSNLWGFIHSFSQSEQVLVLQVSCAAAQWWHITPKELLLTGQWDRVTPQTRLLDILLSAPHLNWDLIICEFLALVIPTLLHLCLYPSLHKGKYQLIWGYCDMAQPLQSPWSFCPSPAKHPASWWIQAAFAGISSCVQLLFYDLRPYPGGVNITYSSHNSPRQLGDLLLFSEDGLGH